MIAFYVVPYKRREHPVRVIRYCAMDDHTATIRADGGTWSEVEIDGDRAVVKVRASRETLDVLATVFERVNRGQAAQLARDHPPRKPRVVDGEFVFDGPARHTKPFNRLDEEVDDD